MVDLRLDIDGAQEQSNIIARHGIRVDRGARALRLPVVAHASQLNFRARDSVSVAEGDDVALMLRAGSAFATRASGVVSQVDPDPRRYQQAVSAHGRLRDLAQLDGVEVALMEDVLISSAIAALMDAAGLAAAEYVVHATTRRIAHFWVEGTDSVLRVLRRLVATDGPYARLYERADGLIVFEPNSFRTTNARAVTLQRAFHPERESASQDIFSRVRRLSDIEPATEAQVPYQVADPADAAVRVRVQGERSSDASLATSVDMSSLQAGERILVCTSYEPQPSSVSPARALREGTSSGAEITGPARMKDSWIWADGDPTRAYWGARSDDSGTRWMAAVSLRSQSGGAPERVGSQTAQRTPASGEGSLSSTLGLPSLAARRGDVVVILVEQGLHSEIPSERDMFPAGWTRIANAAIRQNNYSRFWSLGYIVVAADDWNLNSYSVRTFTDDASYAQVRVQVYRTTAGSEVADMELAANETRDVIVNAGGIVTGSASVTYDVTLGSADLTVTTLTPRAFRLRAVAGSSGATVRAIRVEHSEPLTFQMDTKTASGSSSAQRPLRVPVWTYMGAAAAQACANEWGAYLAQRYQVIEIDVWGDRRAATLQSCLEREISDRVAITGLTSVAVEGWIEAVRLSIGDADLSRFTFRVLEAPVSAPSAPAAPTASDPKFDSMVVHWVAPDDGGSAITSYDLRYRSAQQVRGEWVTVADISQDARSQQLAGLLDDWPYEFEVRATNAIGTGPWSPTSDIARTTDAAVAPSAPAAPFASTTGAVAITWRWVPPADGGALITSYHVRWRQQGSSWSSTLVVRGTPAAPTYETTGLTDGNTYEMQVQAVNVIDVSAWSPTGTARAGTPGTTDRLLLEDGDALLLENGDGLELEG